MNSSTKQLNPKAQSFFIPIVPNSEERSKATSNDNTSSDEQRMIEGSYKMLNATAHEFIPSTTLTRNEDDSTIRINSKKLDAGAQEFTPKIATTGSDLSRRNQNEKLNPSTDGFSSWSKDRSAIVNTVSPESMGFLPSSDRPVNNPNFFQLRQEMEEPMPSRRSRTGNVETLEYPKRDSAICKFFSKGICRMGINCPFLHQTKNLEPHAHVPNAKKDGVPGRVVLEEGLACHFGPGLAIERVEFTNQDIRTLLISGLPASITEDMIRERFVGYGNVLSLSVQCNTISTGRYATVVLEDHMLAGNARKALHGTDSVSWQGGSISGNNRSPAAAISVRIKGNTENVSTIKAQWYRPVSCGWVNFRYEHEARKVARCCDGLVVRGCTVTAKFQKPPNSLNRGRAQTYSVWFGNLDESIQHFELASAVERRTKVKSISASMGRPPFEKHLGPKIVQNLLVKFGGPLTTFELSPERVGQYSQKERALAKFAFEVDAKRAYQHFKNHSKVPELGGTALFLQRLYVAKYTLPTRIAESLRNPLNMALLSHSSARYSVHNNVDTEKTTISINTDCPHSLKEIKDELNILLSGTVVVEKVGGSKVVWYQRLSTPSFRQEFRKTLANDFDVVWLDPQRRTIRVFGPVDQRPKVSNRILDLLQKNRDILAVPIANEHFESILQEGRGFLDKLSVATGCGGGGAQKISLDLKSRSLLLEGGTPKMAQRLQQRLIVLFERRRVGGEGKESTNNAHDDDDKCCPICFCPPDEEEEATIILSSCKHVYCKDCYTTWLSGSNLCSFPLTCLAEGCDSLVQLDDIDLEDTQLSTIFRSCLDDHVRRNPIKYQFCPEIACPGIYQVNQCGEDEGLVGESPCSSCCQSICVACQTIHSPLSCEEYSKANLPPDRIRLQVIDEILTLRCPRCNQAFLDFDGCFAISCSVCPCNFCGWCLKDCGNDAHPHVKSCPKKAKGADSYFGKRQQFEEAQTKMRIEKFSNFLETFETIDKRKEIIQSLQMDLKDLSIDQHFI